MSNNAHELSNRLLNALDNNYNVVDMHTVNEIISVLERINITKELLETTRLGKHVNELRRKTTDPSLARRAKVLVKRWRDLVIPTAASPAHTGSNRSSAERTAVRSRLGGTPLTSPALSRQVVSPAVNSPRPPSRPAWGGYESDSQDVILVDDEPPGLPAPPPPVPALLANTHKPLTPPVKRPPSPEPFFDEKKAKRDKKPKKKRPQPRRLRHGGDGAGAARHGAGPARHGAGPAGLGRPQRHGARAAPQRHGARRAGLVCRARAQDAARRGQEGKNDEGAVRTDPVPWQHPGRVAGLAAVASLAGRHAHRARRSGEGGLSLAEWWDLPAPALPARPRLPAALPTGGGARLARLHVRRRARRRVPGRARARAPPAARARAAPRARARRQRHARARAAAPVRRAARGGPRAARPVRQRRAALQVLRLRGRLLCQEPVAGAAVHAPALDQLRAAPARPASAAGASAAQALPGAGARARRARRRLRRARREARHQAGTGQRGGRSGSRDGRRADARAQRETEGADTDAGRRDVARRGGACRRHVRRAALGQRAATPQRAAHERAACRRPARRGRAGGRRAGRGRGRAVRLLAAVLRTRAAARRAGRRRRAVRRAGVRERGARRAGPARAGPQVRGVARVRDAGLAGGVALRGHRLTV